MLYNSLLGSLPDLALLWCGPFEGLFFLFNSETPPTVVNLRSVGDLSAWMDDPSHVYVGRRCRSCSIQSFWANPFRITSTCTREDAVDRFEELLQNNSNMRLKLFGLAGKVLGCWCAPLNCHAYAIVRAYKQITSEDHATGSIVISDQDGENGSPQLSCRLCEV